MRCETLWKQRLISLGEALLPEHLALHWDLTVCVSTSLVEKKCVESAPHFYSPDVAHKQMMGVVTLLSSMCIGGKGHNGYTSYSSSGVLIKEDEQKTIAGSLLPESQILECGF